MGRYPTGWLIAALVFVVPDNATAQAVNTFSNGEPILINDTAPATPYPSTIAVSGLTGAVVKVRVTLHNLTHAFGADISAWLVAPNGRTMLLLGRAPGATSQHYVVAGRLRAHARLTRRSRRVPSCRAGTAPVSGRSRHSTSRRQRSTMSQLTLSGFNGEAPSLNGNWSLYVRDHAPGLIGTIANGWSLTFYIQPQLPTPRNLTAPNCAKPDYDGDGRSDVAVYRPTTGEWFVLQSSTNTGVVIPWGAPSGTGAGDIAAPGDYDGDGQTDLAVYRESTGTWYVRYSFGGTAAIDWGAPAFLGLGDRPGTWRLRWRWHQRSCRLS